MDPSSAIIVLCTTPDKATATALARLALRRKLAACVNLLPGMTSMYHWQEQLECSEEVQLIFKSDTEHQQDLLSLLKQAHPYDVPELLVIPVQHGDSEYLSWLHASLA